MCSLACVLTLKVSRMKAYSLDLRHRVIAALEKGEGTIEEIAKHFSVSATFVKNLLRLKRETGSLRPRPHGGGAKPLLKEEHLILFRAYIAANPGATRKELQRYLSQQAHLEVSRATISRALQKLSVPKRKLPGPPKEEKQLKATPR